MMKMMITKYTQFLFIFFSPFRVRDRIDDGIQINTRENSKIHFTDYSLLLWWSFDSS